MNIKFFEAVYGKEYYVGIHNLIEGKELLLYKTNIKSILEFCHVLANFEQAINYLNNNIPRIFVPKDKLVEVKLLPPMYPSNSEEVVVCGFMQTHNVKVDEINFDKKNIPNMFIKGIKSSLKTSGETLRIPENFMAICEEAEVVLIYQSDTQGKPQYKGYTFGNDLTDIGRFRSNNAHLSYAKLCDASVSHWFFPSPPPQHVNGDVTIKRDNQVMWNGSFKTGISAIVYDIDNIINNLFSFPLFNEANTIYYVFLGADKSSFHHGATIKNNDEIIINYKDYNITIQNQIKCM